MLPPFESGRGSKKNPVWRGTKWDLNPVWAQNLKEFNSVYAGGIKTFFSAGKGLLFQILTSGTTFVMTSFIGKYQNL